MLLITLFACNTAESSIQSIELGNTTDSTAHETEENANKRTSSEEDTSNYITELAQRLNAKMNVKFITTLDGRGFEEFSPPEVIEEVKKAQEAWLKFKEQELHLIHNHFPDHALDTLELDKVYERKRTFEWCKDLSNYGMRRCALTSIDYYNSLLNTRYKSIRNQLDEKGKERLDNTKLAWIAYQKTEHSIWRKISELHQGSMYPTRSMQNGERVIRQRTMELDHYNTFLSKRNNSSNNDSLVLLPEWKRILALSIPDTGDYIDFHVLLNAIGILKTGKYQGDSLVIGLFEDPAKGANDIYCYLRFIKYGNSLIYLPKMSDPLVHGINLSTDLKLWFHDLFLDVDQYYSIPGFEHKNLITHKKTNQSLILKEVFHSPFIIDRDLDTSGCSIVFHDDILGPIYSRTLRGNKVFENLFYAFRKDATTLIFDLSIPFIPASPSSFDSISFSTKDVEWKKHQYFYKGSIIMDDNNFINTNTKTNEGRDIYRIANGQDDILNMINNNNTHESLWFFDREIAEQDKNALYFIKSPLIENKYLAYVSNKYLATNAVEPILYLYPTKQTDISVSVKAEGGIYKSDPLISSNGWNVSAEPTGKLTNKTDGKEYKYIFWEGITKPLFIENTGYIIRKDSIELFLRKELAHKGLIKNEIDDFLLGWLPKFKSNEYYFISFIDQAKIDELFPLVIEPKPETIIRVYIDSYGLNVPIEVNKPAKHNKVTRKGYSAIEWGGFER